MTSSPAIAARRVLGDKTTNASLTPSKLRNFETSFPRSSPKPPSSPHSIPPRSPQPPQDDEMVKVWLTWKAGRKRPICEVDLPDEQGEPKSRETGVEREDEFHIEDEPPQHTGPAENLNSFTQTLSEQEITLTNSQEPPKNESQDSLRMSSLINFDGDEEDVLGRSEREQADRTRLIANGAARGRTMLQYAAWKVESKQTHKSFDEIESAYANREPSPELPTSVPPASANNPRAKNLALLSAPVLLPTAYSARYVTADDMPSSPPVAATTAKNDDEAVKDLDEAATPTQSKPYGSTPEAKILSSSPSDSNGVEDVAVEGVVKNRVESLTSSVARGKAAKGLMELMMAGSDDSK